MSESGTRDRLRNDLVLLLDVYPGDECADGVMEGADAMRIRRVVFFHFSLQQLS